jgi:hypothetical protein
MRSRELKGGYQLKMPESSIHRAPMTSSRPSLAGELNRKGERERDCRQTFF